MSHFPGNEKLYPTLVYSHLPGGWRVCAVTCQEDGECVQSLVRRMESVYSRVGYCVGSWEGASQEMADSQEIIVRKQQIKKVTPLF